MNDTKRLGFVAVFALLIVGLALVANDKAALADTGYEGATRVEQGSYSQMFKYTGSSIAGTGFISATTKRPDGSCRNNTGSEVWIGTVSATQRGSISFQHDNINFGTFLKSSETFSLGGSFTGDWYFTCGMGVATCEMRCSEGRVQ